MIKKIGLGLCFIGILLLSGCSKEEETNTPKQVSEQFLTAIQEADETALKATSQWDLASISTLQMQESDYLDTIDRDLQKEVHDTLYGFSFTIKDEVQQEESAKVTVTLKVKDIKDSVTKGLKEAEKRVEELSKGKNFSDQQAQKEIMRILYENIRDTKNEKERTVTLALKKSEQGWLVTKNNKALETALLANGEELIKLME